MRRPLLSRRTLNTSSENRLLSFIAHRSPHCSDTILVEVCRMDAADFRRIALSLEGVEEGSHMGSPGFRVGGRIFATLAAQHQGYGNLMLTPEVQADFVNELASAFIPVAGG